MTRNQKFWKKPGKIFQETLWVTTRVLEIFSRIWQYGLICSYMLSHNNPKWSFEENNNDLFFNFYAIASSNNLKTRHFKYVQKVRWIHTSCIQVIFLWFISYGPYRGPYVMVNYELFQPSPRRTIQQKMLGHIQQQCQHQGYLLELE